MKDFSSYGIKAVIYQKRISPSKLFKPLNQEIMSLWPVCKHRGSNHNQRLYPQRESIWIPDKPFQSWMTYRDCSENTETQSQNILEYVKHWKDSLSSVKVVVHDLKARQRLGKNGIGVERK